VRDRGVAARPRGEAPPHLANDISRVVARGLEPAQVDLVRDAHNFADETAGALYVGHPGREHAPAAFQVKACELSEEATREGAVQARETALDLVHKRGQGSGGGAWVNDGKHASTRVLVHQVHHAAGRSPTAPRNDFAPVERALRWRLSKPLQLRVGGRGAEHQPRQGVNTALHTALRTHTHTSHHITSHAAPRNAPQSEGMPRPRPKSSRAGPNPPGKELHELEKGRRVRASSSITFARARTKEAVQIAAVHAEQGAPHMRRARAKPISGAQSTKHKAQSSSPGN